MYNVHSKLLLKNCTIKKYLHNHPLPSKKIILKWCNYEYILIFNILYTYFYGWGKFCILWTIGQTTVVHYLIIISCSWKPLNILVLSIFVSIMRINRNLQFKSHKFNIQYSTKWHFIVRHLNYPRWPSDETAATAASP